MVPCNAQITFLSKFIAIIFCCCFFYYKENFDIYFFISEQTAFDFLNRWTANKLDAVVVGVE